MTCTPYGINTHRLLVRGARIENIDKKFFDVKVVGIDFDGEWYLFDDDLSYLENRNWKEANITRIDNIIPLTINANPKSINPPTTHASEPILSVLLFGFPELIIIFNAIITILTNTKTLFFYSDILSIFYSN